MIVSFNSELFWVEHYFVLKGNDVFCSPLSGDTSLKAFCVPVRAGPGCPPGPSHSLVRQRPPCSPGNSDRWAFLQSHTNYCLQCYDKKIPFAMKYFFLHHPLDGSRPTWNRMGVWYRIMKSLKGDCFGFKEMMYLFGCVVNSIPFVLQKMQSVLLSLLSRSDSANSCRLWVIQT